MVAAAAASPTPSRFDASATAASSFDSEDFATNGGGGRESEVDLSQLFSDVSRTVGNLKNILSSSNRDSLGGGGGGSDINQSAGTSSRLQSAGNILDDIMGSRDDQQPGPIAKLFGGGNVCFKTCGMEDIQFAARRAGEMFFTMKVCLIILTFVAVLCFLAITVAVLFYMYKNRHALRHLTSSSSNGISDEGNISVTPLIFSKRTPPLLSNNGNNNNAPKPPAHAHSAHQQKHSPVSSLNSSSTD